MEFKTVCLLTSPPEGLTSPRSGGTKPFWGFWTSTVERRVYSLLLQEIEDLGWRTFLKLSRYIGR